MTIQSPFSFSDIIGFSFVTITLLFVACLVIYVLKRMWQKNKCKLVWTPIDSVERRNNLSYDEFVREYASVNKPVIITDAMQDWKAPTKWTLDFFRSEYGSVKNCVMDCEARSFVSMTIANYIDYMTSSKRDKLLYLHNLSICNHPELLKDYEEPILISNYYKKISLKLLKKYHENAFAVIIGSKDTSIGLHHDNGDIAWIAVISGCKQVILFSPDQTKYLYDGQVDCFNPNIEKFPLYANAKQVECILNQGEIIYIPPIWWHQLRNLEDTIALTHNVVNESNYELVCQQIVETSPIKGHLFSLILQFPWLGKVLLATGLV